MATRTSGHHDAHPATPTAHCHGNGHHQPSHLLPGRPACCRLSQSRPALSPRYFGQASKRTGLAPQVRIFTLSAVRSRQRQVGGESTSSLGIATWTGPNRNRHGRGQAREVCQVARLQRRRCDRRCASILRPRQPITTRISAGASQPRNWNPAVNNASCDQKP